MKDFSQDYLEYCLNTCLILFFKKYGFEYRTFTHFINENILENFLGNNNDKEFYLATTKRKDKWYFLRPELTYISLLESGDLQNTFYCYSGYCYRHERKQFCRFREFLQFGAEACFSNKNKVRYCSYYFILLSLMFLKEFVNISFLKENIIFDLFYINEQDKNELELLVKNNSLFNMFFFTQISNIERQGNGVTPYTGITFEYHVRSDAKGYHKEKHKYEFLGGGEYTYTTHKDNCYYGTGFGVGTKRFMLCEFNFNAINNFIVNNIKNNNVNFNLIFNSNNNDMNLFFSNIMNNLYSNVNSNNTFSISVSNNYNYTWKFKNSNTILL